MKRSREALFLERQTYRRRRLTDAARLMPILGALLFCVPVLVRDGASEAPISTGAGLFYFFGIWCALILVTRIISVYLARPDKEG